MGTTADYCLVRIQPGDGGHDVLVDLTQARLRSTDAVYRRDNDLIAVIVGDVAAAERAAGRVCSATADPDVAAEVLTDAHPVFEQLAAQIPDLDSVRARPPIPSSSDPRRPATVVIADRDTDVRQMLAQLLARVGWRTVVTGDPDAVVDLCRGAVADALVTDYNLDGRTSGVDVGRGCREAGLTMPIYVFAAQGWPSAAEDIVRIGAQEVMSKSDVGMLLDALGRLAERLRRAHRRANA